MQYIKKNSLITCCVFKISQLETISMQWLAQGREQALPPPTAWTPTKILSPNIRYFVAILRFVGI